jgi:hypothetical protein
VELAEIGELELTYVSLESLDFGGRLQGGQIYGTMEGTVHGPRLNGQLRLTNLAHRRADDVNLPTLRGVLTTDDGAAVWVELDGIATLRAEDGARVFVTACRFQCGDDSYNWLNTVVGALEGVLDTVGVGGTAHGRLFECRPTLT